MKRILVLIALLTLIGSTSYAGDLIINDKIGIGTNSPSNRLHIRGSGTEYLLRLDSPSIYGTSLLFFNDNNDVTGNFRINVGGTVANRKNALQFYSVANSNGDIGTNIMTLTNSGNVGIGTETPGQALSVAGTIESTTGGFKFPDGTTQSAGANVTYGLFAVGGTSSSYYPVRFTNSIYGSSGPSTSDLVIFRDNTHENGSWFGTFNLVVSFHPTKWGHFSGQIEKLIYQTDSRGTPYNDPVGDITDGSVTSGGRDIVVWLKGGATYHWRNTQVIAGWTLTDGNPGGTSITDSSGITRNPISSQSTLILNAKNSFYTNAIGLGTAKDLYVGGNVGIGTATPNAKLDIAGTVNVSDTLSSTKPCAAGYTRILPNYCRRNTESSVYWLNNSTSQCMSYKNTGLTGSGAKLVHVRIGGSAYSSNSVGQRHNGIKIYSDSACSNLVSNSLFMTWEWIAQTAGNVFYHVEKESIFPVQNGDTFYWETLNGGGDGSISISLIDLGYFD